MSGIVKLQLMPNTRRLVVTTTSSIRVVEAITVLPDAYSGSSVLGFDSDQLMAAIQNTMATELQPHRMDSYMYLGKDAEVES